MFNKTELDCSLSDLEKTHSLIERGEGMLGLSLAVESVAELIASISKAESVLIDLTVNLGETGFCSVFYQSSEQQVRSKIIDFYKEKLNSSDDLKEQSIIDIKSDALIYILPVKEKEIISGLVIGIFKKNLNLDLVKIEKQLISYLAIQMGKLLTDSLNKIETSALQTDLKMVYKIGELVTSSLDIDEIVNRIVISLRKEMSADEVNVIRYDEETNMLIFLSKVIRLTSSGEKIFDQYPLSDGMNSYIIKTEKPLLITDDSIKACERLKIRHGGMAAKSWLGVPIMLHEKVTGVISVQSYTKTMQYDQRSVKLLIMVANYCAIAIENARLFESVKLRKKEKEKIFFTLAHDLFSLVNAISGFSKLMIALPENGSQKEYVEFAKCITDSTDKMYRFVDDLLTWWKVSQGKLTLNISRVDFRKILIDTVYMLRAEILIRSLIVDIDGRILDFESNRKLQLKPMMVDIDKKEMERVLINLIDNAIKYSDRKISIITKFKRKFAVCRIKNDGRGVAKNKIDILFDEFYQDTGNKVRGVGLGLPIVKKIINLHGGSLFVESCARSGFQIEFSWSKTLTNRFKGKS